MAGVCSRCVQPPDSIRSSSLVTLTRPPTSSSSRITDRSFQFHPVSATILLFHASLSGLSSLLVPSLLLTPMNLLSHHPVYLGRLVRVADLHGRHSLHSKRSNRLLVPSIRLSTLSSRSFPVTGPSIWNNLPNTVTSAPTLSTFRRRLKTYLFSCPSLTLL